MLLTRQAREMLLGQVDRFCKLSMDPLFQHLERVVDQAGLEKLTTTALEIGIHWCAISAPWDSMAQSL